MECITALYILQCNPGVVFWELETFEIWTPEVQSNSNEEPPFLQWEIGNHILQDKVQIIIPMSYHIILSEYFLSPTTTSLVKKKKIVYFSNFCLSFLSYICLLESCGVTTWKLWAALSNTIRAWFNTWFKICDAVIKGNFRNIFDLGNYSHEL